MKYCDDDDDDDDARTHRSLAKTKRASPDPYLPGCSYRAAIGNSVHILREVQNSVRSSE